MIQITSCLGKKDDKPKASLSNSLLSPYLSLGTRLLDRFNSQAGKQPFKGDCNINEDDDKCLCLEEIDDKQLKLLLLSVRFSLSAGWLQAICSTAGTRRASGKTQLKAEPAILHRVKTG